MTSFTQFEVKVDLDLYALEVVFRVCYLYTDLLYLWLTPDESNKIRVVGRAKNPKQDLSALEGEFANALIDYAVRRDVALQTQTIRDHIVRQALAEAIRED